MPTNSRFAELMNKAGQHPNKLSDAEIKELASLIPDQMHSMSKETKQKWFDSFANHTFLEYLMNPNSNAIVAFGELCRQAYKSGALWRILGNVSLQNEVLPAIQVEIEAEIQESLKCSFLDRLFRKRPTARIILDPARFTSAVTNENRLKINNVIADALLDVICKCENHPCSKEIKSFPELSEIRDTAKLSILRTLEVSIGMQDVEFTIAKSCRHNEGREKQKLLEKIEIATKERKNFFEEAKKKGITIQIDYVQESAKQLQKVKTVLERANGSNTTFAYDMVALNLADEKSFEAYLLAHEFLNCHHELSWMRVFLSFSAGSNKATSRQIEEAIALFSKRPSISLLEELKQRVQRLREVTITPMSLWQVVNEVSTSLSQDQAQTFKNQLRSLNSTRDPNSILQFQKLQSEIYDALRSNQQGKSSAVKNFTDIYKQFLEGRAAYQQVQQPAHKG